MKLKRLCNSFSQIKFQLVTHSYQEPCQLYKLTYSDNKITTQATTNRQQCLRYLRSMQIMRRMEMSNDFLYRNRQIRGFCHLYTGQQAIAQGMEAALTFDDPISAAYRIHCYAYKRGYSVRQIVGEMLGKMNGATKGKGGSMHYYSKKNNFYGGNGIVGAQIPLGTGLGFALKYKRQKNVAVSLYGDGAANQGQLFQAANMAALWHLPVLFVCENNLYGMGTSTQRASFNTKFYTRGDLIPGIRANGNNLFMVRQIIKWGKAYSILNGPLFIEFMTYRYGGHSMSDPGTTYRTREQVQTVRMNKDPLKFLKDFMLHHQLANENKLKKMRGSLQILRWNLPKKMRMYPSRHCSMTFMSIIVSVDVVDQISSEEYCMRNHTSPRENRIDLIIYGYKQKVIKIIG